MKWFKRLVRGWNPWYTLEVTHRGKIQRIIVKDFKKKTPKILSGWDADGKWFELVSTEPMDYFIEEYTEDLK